MDRRQPRRFQSDAVIDVRVVVIGPHTNPRSARHPPVHHERFNSPGANTPRSTVKEFHWR
jgi:hypothetical protein